MALDTLYTSPTYNSFFSVAEMSGFIQRIKWTHGGDAAWLALSLADQESIILGSVNYINGHQWIGTLNSAVIVTTMTWPRDPYGTTTPSDIGLASACWILNSLNGLGQGGSTAAIGAIKKRKVGDVSIEYETGGGGSGAIEEKTCAEKYAGLYLILEVASGGIGGVGLGKYP